MENINEILNLDSKARIKKVSKGQILQRQGELTSMAFFVKKGLAGRWEFNGNTFDESGTGNNGIVNGATLTSDRFGNVSSAYYFDGFNDYWIVKLYNTGNITWQKSLGGSSGDVAPSHQKTLM
tara:strand:- start:63 stop:431 length:369 start_codon:yes stop_codon:yes gene_type:complete